MSRAGVLVDDQIEFLSPRDSLFGGDTPDAEPTPGWPTGPAALAVMALLCAAIVAVAPWTGTDSNVAPPTSTLGPARSAVQPVPTPHTGFVFDPIPDGFALGGAWRDTTPTGTVTEQSEPGWGQVWATADASMLTGAWFSITLLNHPFDAIAPGATRLDLGGRNGLLEQADDGTLRLSAPIGQITANRSLTIKSVGRSADELIALFRSIGIDDGRPHFDDPSQLDGFEMLASEPTDHDLIDAYLLTNTRDAWTYYADNAADEYIAVDTAPRNDDLDPLARLAIGTVQMYPKGSAVANFPGHDLVIGSSDTGPEIVARWDDGDATIMLRTNVSAGNLVRFLASLRHASEAEWAATERRASQAGQSGVGDVQASGGTPFGGGTFPNGSTWSATVQPPDRAVIEVDRGMVAFSLPDGTERNGPIQVWSFPVHTIVTAITPANTLANIRANTNATMLRISVGQGPATEVTMIEVTASDRRSSFTGKAAAAAFVSTGPFEVDLLDGDGNIIDHFSSPKVES